MKGTPNSEDLNRLLAGEVTTTQLAQLFHLSVQTCRGRLAGLKPLREDGRGAVVYRFHEAAPLLSRLPDDVVTQVMRLNHMDLPPLLRKEYWTGQMQMLRVREAEGELYRVDTVIAYVGELLKTLRMGVLLMSDSVERETTFTSRQRDALKLLQDTLLENIRDEAQRIFAGRYTDPAGQPGVGHGEYAVATLAEQAADL